MTALTLPQRNGASAHVEVWRQASVKAFFSGCNWEDNSVEIQQLKATAQTSSEPLSLTLSVSQFFSALDWEDNAIAAPVISAAPTFVAAPTVDLTLDDFSNLF